MENWCPFIRSLEAKHPEINRQAMVGLEIEIDTTSMTKAAKCDGTVWLLTPASMERIREVAGGDLKSWERTNTWFCNHMLEMD